MDLFHDNRVKLAFVVALLGLAGVLTWRFIQSDTGPSEQSFFYDQSAKKLFPARRDLIPILPSCVGGQPIPEDVAAIFNEGACVVAAHQARVGQGRPGYVDDELRAADSLQEARVKELGFFTQ